MMVVGFQLDHMSELVLGCPMMVVEFQLVRMSELVLVVRRLFQLFHMNNLMSFDQQLV